MNQKEYAFIVQEEVDLYWRNITNDDLICRHCQNVTPATCTCLNFTKHKPSTLPHHYYMEILALQIPPEALAIASINAAICLHYQSYPTP